MKKLTICIPAYNRIDVFKHSLRIACDACLNHSSQVSIIISDNNSIEDLYSVVKEIENDYLSINIKYFKQLENIGMANNFLKVVEHADSEYCWIIGSDDFIKPYAIKMILDILKDNSNLSFINLNYDLLDLNIHSMELLEYSDIKSVLGNSINLINHIAPIESYKLTFDHLIDPKFNNVFLGAVMTSVFRKSIWDSVSIESISYSSFDSLVSVYPHCSVFAQGFIGSNAYYCGLPLITVGEGKREWSTETGNRYWDAPVAYIHFTIIPEIIESYHLNGLDNIQYERCKRFYASTVGSMFFPAFLNKFFIRINRNVYKNLRILRIFLLYKGYLRFYRSALGGLYGLFFKKET